MKRCLIRGLWGDISNSTKYKADIEKSKTKDGNLEFVCYTFGIDNHKYLSNIGVKSILINNEPSRYSWLWRHKLDIYKSAMMDYDEITYIDWNCNLKRPFPVDFWDIMGKKDIVQGCLYRWNKKPAAPWRSGYNSGYVINNGFLYMRDKKFPDKLIEEWSKFPEDKWWKRNDETVTSFCLDKMMGGWQGEDYWFKHFEPELAYQECNPVFKIKPNIVFYHYIK